jgi:hypothetical protein
VAAPRPRAAAAARAGAEERKAERNEQNKAKAEYSRFEEMYKELYTQSYPGMNKKSKVIRLSRNWLGIELTPSSSEKLMKVRLHPDRETNIERRAKKTILFQYI